MQSPLQGEIIDDHAGEECAHETTDILIAPARHRTREDLLGATPILYNNERCLTKIDRMSAVALSPASQSPGQQESGRAS